MIYDTISMYNQKGGLTPQKHWKGKILMPQIPQISGPLTGGKTLTSGNSGSNVPQGADPFSINGVNPVQRPTSVTQKGGSGNVDNANLSGTQAGSLGVPAAKDPSMAVETLHDVFSGDLLENAKLNGYTELVGEIDDLTKAIYINPDKLMNEILTQEKDNTVFSGNKLFDILRNVSANSGDDTKELIANMLKSLNYLMSRNDIIQAVKSNIKFLADYFGKGTTLSKNLNQLYQKWDSGNPAENFEALKNETAALMKSIEGSLQNDSRTEVLVPLVTHNLSRYNTNEYMMKEAFSQLMSQIPSSSTRDELSKAFTEFASKLIAGARNGGNSAEQAAQAPAADVSAEKAAILIYLSRLTDSAANDRAYAEPRADGGSSLYQGMGAEQQNVSGNAMSGSLFSSQGTNGANGFYGAAQQNPNVNNMSQGQDGYPQNVQGNMPNGTMPTDMGGGAVQNNGQQSNISQDQTGYPQNALINMSNDMSSGTVYGEWQADSGVQGNKGNYYQSEAPQSNAAASQNPAVGRENIQNNALNGILLSAVDSEGKEMGSWQPAAVDENGNVLNINQLAAALGKGNDGGSQTAVQKFAVLDKNGFIASEQRLAALNEKGEQVSGRQLAMALENKNLLGGLRFAAVDRNGNILSSQRFLMKPDDNGGVFEQRFAAVDDNGEFLRGQSLLNALRDGLVMFAAVDKGGNILSGQRFLTVDTDGFPVLDRNAMVDENGNALGGQVFASVDKGGNLTEGQTYVAINDSEKGNELDFDSLFRSYPNNPKSDRNNNIREKSDRRGDIEAARYKSLVPLSENRISYVLNNFDSGLIKGKDAIDKLLSLLIPRNAPDSAEIMHTVVQGTDNLADLVNFLNKVLENTPDIPERQTLCDAFEDIVGEMAKTQEMPTQKFSGYESETMKALTSFIDRNVNHPAIRGIDNFNASNLLQSMLNAPGVFTPLAHYIIPLQVEDTRAFGELWVDNDNCSRKGGGEDKEKQFHLFLTFDVEAVGRFEVDAYSKGKSLNLSVLYPKSYRYRVSSLTDKITKIAAGVGFNVENFKTGILFKPHSLAETFPRINENRRNFDVKA